MFPSVKTEGIPAAWRFTMKNHTPCPSIDACTADTFVDVTVHDTRV
jgi:hypothetical protein